MATLTIKPDAGPPLTVDEAAELAGVHRSTVDKWIRRGLLAAGRAGPRLRMIRREALREFLRRYDPEDAAGLIERLERRQEAQDAAVADLDRRGIRKAGA